MDQQHNNQSDRNSTPSKKRGAFRHILKIIGTTLMVLIVIGLMGTFFVGAVGAGYVAYLVKDDPVRTYDEIYDKIFSNYLTGFAYFRDETLIGELRAEEDRRLVHLDEVSEYLINAVIATEDRHFYEHMGIVPKSLIRATIQDLTNSPVQTGGSTLTQQLIKNTLLSSEVTHERKAREIFLALRIERMFSKDQILEAYLNEIYFGKNANGSNIYGVQAAAKGIFGKDVKDLNLAESAYLAGIPQSPITYSPFTKEGLEAGSIRQKTMLNNMLEHGYITQSEYDEALAYDIGANLAQPSTRAYSRYPFLMMEIEERAAKALADQALKEKNQTREDISVEEYRTLVEEKRKEILRNGYKIYTTIDRRVHEIMQEIASNPENFGPNRTYKIGDKVIENALEEVGSMLIDNDSGQILGMIGGRDFNVEQTNHATARRQPGSAMKPIAAYAPAFEEGILQPASVIDDVPVILPDGTKKQHIPANWDNKFHGLMTARDALKYSYNIPAIKAYLNVGIPQALNYVKNMGVTTLVEADNYASTGVIGGLTYGLTVEEITNAYATFANGGSFVDAYMIERIEDNNGQLIFQHESQPVSVFSEQTAYLMTDMMRSVVSQSGGTGIGVRQHVGWQVDIAGKTGTTNYDKDSWFIAFTPRLSMGVWIGYDEPYTLGGQSKRNAIEIWGKVMKRIFEEYPDLSPTDEKFKQPDGIVARSVCSKSGDLSSELCKKAGFVISDIFNKKYVPTKTDESLQEARVIVIDEERYLAKESTPDDMVVSGIFVKRPEPLIIPENTSKPKEYYRPTDWELTLPEEEDPREGDGKVPVEPQGVAVSGGTGDSPYKITWHDNMEQDVAGYRIYRAENGERNFVKAGVVRLSEPKEWVDEQIQQGNIYAYYVTAVDIEGNESNPSGIVLINRTGQDNIQNPWEDNNGIPDWLDNGDDQNGNGDDPVTTLPSIPKNVKISEQGESVLISWDPNPDQDNVSNYHIYFTNDLNSRFQLVGSTSETSFSTKSISEAGWFQVTAINLFGESLPSPLLPWKNPAASDGATSDDQNQGNQDQQPVNE